MSIAVTQHYINTSLAQSPDFNIEPMKTSPTACLQYIENQGIMNPICWPDGSVVDTIKHSTCTFQQRAAGNSQSTWPVVLDTATREGVPWYSMKRIAPLQIPSKRNAHRIESRRHALPRRPNWVIPDLIVPDPAYATALCEAIQNFGHNSLRTTADGFQRWAGQPVIVCRDTEDRALAYEHITRLHLCVAHVITYVQT